MGSRVLKATFFITLAHALRIVFSIIQSRIIGDVYGMGTEYDAYVIAFEGVIWTFFLIGEESLAPALLPIFMDAKSKDGEARAWHFTSTILNLQLGIVLVVTALLYFFPREAVDLLTRNDGIRDAAEQAKLLVRKNLAVHFLGSMSPTLIGISLSSLTYVIINGYKEFFWPAFADAALKIALVAGVFIGHAMGLSSDSLIVGALAAGAAKFGVHLLALGRRLKFYRPTLDLNDPYVRKFLYVVAPLLAGIVFAKTRDYFNNIYILSSLETGMLSINSAGRKIFSTVGSLVPYPLSIAMFPFLCELVAKDDNKAFGEFLTRSSRMLILFFLPLSVVIFMLSEPLGRLVFETGQVDATSAANAGLINSFYCMVLPFTALEFIFMQAYFSQQRTVSVTVIGIFSSTLSMLISYVGVVHYGMKGLDAVIVVALGFSMSKALKSILLIAVLKHQGLPVMPFTSTMLFALRVIVLGIACGGASYATLKVVNRVMPAKIDAVAANEESKPAPVTEVKPAPVPEPPAAQTPKDAKPGEPEKKKPVSGLRAALRAAPRLAIPGLAAVAIFLLGCKLLRLEELDEMIAFAKEKMKRRKKKPA